MANVHFSLPHFLLRPSVNVIDWTCIYYKTKVIFSRLRRVRNFVKIVHLVKKRMKYEHICFGEMDLHEFYLHT